MTDARWIDVDSYLQSAIRDFEFAVKVKEAGSAEDDPFERHKSDLAFMHAVQSAHTSAESALLKILNILNEHRPEGENWHQDLLNRAGIEIAGDRTAILPRDVIEDLQETRRFRHLAMHDYDSFDVDRTEPTVSAIRRLIESLAPAVNAFRKVIDPEETEENDGGGDGSGGGMSGGPR